MSNYYRISEDIALRSWQFVPQAYYRRSEVDAIPLTDEEFDLMLLCDGEHELPDSPLLNDLHLRGLIQRCQKGEKPSEWSAYKKYPHRYFPEMILMMTGRCNYNCIHCFNAMDNEPLNSEWSWEDLKDLLDQASDCGVHAFTITGGEPMHHAHFMDVMRYIYEKNMVVKELNTNGYYITQEILDELKSFGCKPLIKISFDGVGFHDRIRNRKGSEELTIEKMRLVSQNGFALKSQTQVNRINVSSMMETAKLMNSLGVRKIRITRTNEVPRWIQMAGDASLPPDEYYDHMIRFAGEYAKSGLSAEMTIWNLIHISPRKRSYRLVPVVFPKGKYQPTRAVCADCRRMINVRSNGDLLTCLQIGGGLDEMGERFENLHETPLADILYDSRWQKLVCTNVHRITEVTPECAQCPYFKYCAGGCRALGMLISDARYDYIKEHGTAYGLPFDEKFYLAPDKTKCAFFKQGWYEKAVEAMGDWKNLSEI
ncbi:MAG: radical SAM protein [Lachnospiraceae bacterium]|nr:radical SAM protein [Lachnospiraceae bacterium]